MWLIDILRDWVLKEMNWFPKQLLLIERILQRERYDPDKIDSMFSTKDREKLRKSKSGRHPSSNPYQRGRGKRRKCYDEQEMTIIPNAAVLNCTDVNVNTKAMQLFGDNETLVGQLNLEVSIDGLKNASPISLYFWDVLGSRSNSIFAPHPQVFSAMSNASSINKLIAWQSSFWTTKRLPWQCLMISTTLVLKTF